jgi:archaetidylinositol phosphate synthase
MLTKLKEKVQAMFAAEARAAHKMRLTPNRVSLIGIVLAFASAIAYAQWEMDRLYLLLATALLLLSGFCDALDGVIARLYQQATSFGGFFDSVLDRYADAAVFAALILSRLCDLSWGLVALAGSLLVSYSRARAEAAGVKMESIGLAERAERMLILALAGVVAIFWESPAVVMNMAVILLAILSNLTVVQRSLYAYGKLKKGETSD